MLFKIIVTRPRTLNSISDSTLLGDSSPCEPDSTEPQYLKNDIIQEKL